MPRQQPIGLVLRLAVRRTLMRAQRRYAIADAVEPLQDALEIIIDDLLGREPEMLRHLGYSVPSTCLPGSSCPSASR